MMPEKLLLIGAGGQGKVVIDAILSAKLSFDIIVADDDERKQGQILLGRYPIMASVGAALGGARVFHVAIGNNLARAQVTEYLLKKGLVSLPLTHHKAYIAETAHVGDGAFVAAQAVVGPDANIETGCIVNHGAIVDHDCEVAAFSHVAPGATLAGGVRVGKRVLIGAGANILPGVTVGDDCVIGAGAVVLNDLESGSVYVGVPAHRYK